MPRITEMFAFVVDDHVHTGPDGQVVDVVEGLIGCELQPGVWTPFVGADMKMVERLRPFAIALARQLGRDVRLMRFTAHELVETIPPSPIPQGHG